MANREIPTKKFKNKGPPHSGTRLIILMPEISKSHWQFKFRWKAVKASFALWQWVSIVRCFAGVLLTLFSSNYACSPLFLSIALLLAAFKFKALFEAPKWLKANSSIQLPERNSKLLEYDFSLAQWEPFSGVCFGFLLYGGKRELICLLFFF